MDNIVLGLLLLSGRTIYQLRERIEKGVSLMYSSSTGSIQAALKKLLSLGYIRCDEAQRSGRRKKVYSITDSGRRSFFRWVNAPIDERTPKSPELIKIYFMGFSDREKREERIARYLDFLRGRLRLLEEICGQADAAGIPAESRDVFNYQLACARYGRDLMRFNIGWFEEMLEQMRRGEL